MQTIQKVLFRDPAGYSFWYRGSCDVVMELPIAGNPGNKNHHLLASDGDFDIE